MIEPVAWQDLLATVITAAVLIISGAGYALCYARYRQSRLLGFVIAAVLCYGALLVSVFYLSLWAHFDHLWRWLSGLLVVGYGYAPAFIWHLCVKTHADYHEDKS